MSAPSVSRSSLWSLRVLFVLIAVFSVILLTRAWHASLLDRYEFRQIQTAITTYWIAQDGWQLAYPTPLFGPPWSIPMEFPTYQVIVAHWHHLTGMPLEQSARLISIVFLFALLPAAFDLLAAWQLPASRRLIVLAIILSSPVYLFYARAFMIETTALCLAVWFLAAFRRSLSRPTWGWILATTVLAALAALTKITTFIVFGLPAVALAIAALRAAAPDSHRPAMSRLALATLVPALLSLGLTWWWVRFSDGIKNSNPLTGFLNSHELHRWNFGDWALRGEWSFWIHLQENITRHVLAEGALAVALLCWPFASGRIRWAVTFCVLGFFSGPLIFANLYHIHDYYYTANALLLSGSAGLLLAACWDEPRWPRGMNWLAAVIMLSSQFYAFYRDYYTHLRDPAPVPPVLAAAIKQAVPPRGIVLIYGADWNPLLPYYAQRRAVMVPGTRENETSVLDDVLRQIPDQPVAAMVIQSDKLRARSDFIRERARRFGLADVPAVSSPLGDLYLPMGASPPAHTAPVPGPDAFTLGLTLAALDSLDLSMIQPRPTQLRTLYGFANGPQLGRTVLNAHAPSEVEIMAPPGATRIKAVVGLPDAAYAAGQAARTDGVTIDIFELSKSGVRRTLYHRELNPAVIATDRGPQTIELTSVPPYTGSLVFRLGTGAKSNPTNDWAYWAQIDIR